LTKGAFVFIFPVVFLLDYFSKQYAILHPEMFLWNSGFGIELYLHYAENTGAAWGILQEYSKYLFTFRLAAIGALMLYLLARQMSGLKIFSLSLLISGAACNVIDTLTKGYVVDMIHFIFWDRSFGIFNIADAFIFLGVIGLMMNQKQTNKNRCTSHAE